MDEVMTRALGHVMAAGGSQVTAYRESGVTGAGFGSIGDMVKVRCAEHDAVGIVSAARVEPGSPPRDVLVIELFGELVPSCDGRTQFSRGVSRYPASGAPVVSAREADLSAIFGPPSGTNLRIGTLYHHPARSAFLLMDPLLTRHFAVLGSTGSGKSCATTLILSTIAAEHPNAHIVLLDPHNEYATAFGDVAEVLDVDNLQMPFWFFDFEEAVKILIRGGTAQEQEAQAIILKDAMTRHAAIMPGTRSQRPRLR
jgi:DNA helicase HerA-like ATPase